MGQETPDRGHLSISFYSGWVIIDLLVWFSVSLSSPATIKLDGLLFQSIFGLNLAWKHRQLLTSMPGTYIPQSLSDCSTFFHCSHYSLNIHTDFYFSKYEGPQATWRWGVVSLLGNLLFPFPVWRAVYSNSLPSSPPLTVHTDSKETIKVIYTHSRLLLQGTSLLILQCSTSVCVLWNHCIILCHLRKLLDLASHPFSVLFYKPPQR